MKKLFIFLFLVVSFMVVFAGDTIKVLRIHHNGSYTDIPLAKINSITHSEYDENGSPQPNVVSSVVQTADNQYTFPISDIESAEVIEKEVEGEKQSLCPDNNHPHMIDLGLPSGTKWACCNVGASSPEEFGGYYAFGEINGDKGEYNWDNYAYKNSDYYTYDIHIDNCLGGSGKDAAKVYGRGYMPTFGQVDELLLYCNGEDRIFYKLNGVNGLLLTGPSGAKIFLPATGEDYTQKDRNVCGRYYAYMYVESLNLTFCYVYGFGSPIYTKDEDYINGKEGDLGFTLGSQKYLFRGRTIRPVNENLEVAF